MLMNFVVDDDNLIHLLEEAQNLGQHRTKEEAVEAALKEYVQERLQQRNT
jgi:hypothetical protein